MLTELACVVVENIRYPRARAPRRPRERRRSPLPRRRRRGWNEERRHGRFVESERHEDVEEQESKRQDTDEEERREDEGTERPSEPGPEQYSYSPAGPDLIQDELLDEQIQVRRGPILLPPPPSTDAPPKEHTAPRQDTPPSMPSSPMSTSRAPATSLISSLHQSDLENRKTQQASEQGNRHNDNDPLDHNGDRDHGYVGEPGWPDVEGEHSAILSSFAGWEADRDRGQARL